MRENKGNPRYPVITLVLYFSYKKHWDAPVSLHQVVNVPEILKPYVTDMRINLFEIAYLTDAQLECFHSDFRIVADYFVQKQRSGDYHPGKEQMLHVEAVLHLLSVMTGDTRFEEVLNQEDGKSVGGVKSMCDVLDRAEARGEAKGEAKLAKLLSLLFSLGRIEDVRKAVTDEAYRIRLFQEFQM